MTRLSDADTYFIVTTSIFYKDDFGRVRFEYFVQ